MDFSNSLVFITGTSRGLGKALAKGFLDQGADVIGLGRSSTVEHPNYSHLTIDLSIPENIFQLNLESTDSQRQMILINNAGRLGKIAAFQELQEEDIVQTANLNFLAPLLLTKKFLDLKCNESVSKFVMNIGSGAAYNEYDGWSMYCSTKAGLAMFSKVVHLESKMGRTNCRIVDLSPGIIDTQMQDEIRSKKPTDFSQLERFEEYKQNGDLQSADFTAEIIIRNFDSLFKKESSSDSVRNYK